MIKQWIIRTGVMGCLFIFVFVFPVFRIESLSEKKSQELSNEYNAVDLVEAFWRNELSERISNAGKFEDFYDAFSEDPSDAMERFGNKVGLNSKYHFMLRLRAVIIAADKNSVILRPVHSDEVFIEVHRGPLFGNAVRDGSGVFDVEYFADSRTFNQVSEELNKRVEQEVLPGFFKESKAGNEMVTVGCFSVSNNASDIKSLKWIPLSLKIQGWVQ
jgi:predicted lipoprotein